MNLLEKWQKVGNKRVKTLFNKVIGENDKCVFYFYLKNEGTFWPAQYHSMIMFVKEKRWVMRLLKSKPVLFFYMEYNTSVFGIARK